MKNGYWIIFAVFLTATFSCRQPKPLEYRKTSDLKFNSLRFPNSEITLRLELYNPNSFRVKVKNADIDVYINDSYIGKVLVVKGRCLIPRESPFELPVKLAVDLNQVLPNAAKLLFDRTVIVKVSGKIRAGKHGIFINVPVYYESKQQV